MGLFNLSDIIVNAPKEATGPLGILNNTQYALNTFRYPEDLSSSDKGHYMVININEQRQTSYKDPGGNTNQTPTAILNNQTFGSSAAGAGKLLQTAGAALEQATSFVEQAASFGGSIVKKFSKEELTGNRTGLGPALVGFGSESLAIARDVGKALQTGSIRAQKRTTDTVALYMPDTLVFDENQSYSDIESGGTILAAGVAMAGSTVDLYKETGGINKAFGKQLPRNAFPFAASILAKEAGGLQQIAFSQASGVVQNPMLELLYSKPSFRTFRFEFMFYPRSEKEGKGVQDIIERLRFHQAPEVAQGGTGGFFMVPPSEFDISFYYNGKENPNIPKISTCVLTQFSVDYAPNGFSAYEVPGQAATKGGTGMPVAIRLSLQFKETEIVTKTLLKNQSGSVTPIRYGTNIRAENTITDTGNA
jgi:hypothetical protein